MPRIIRVNNARYEVLVGLLHEIGYDLTAHGIHHREVWRHRGDQAVLEIEHIPLENHPRKQQHLTL